MSNSDEYTILRVLDVKQTNVKGKSSKQYLVAWKPSQVSDSNLDAESKRHAEFCKAKVLGPIDEDENLSRKPQEMMYKVRRFHHKFCDKYEDEVLSYADVREIYASELCDYFASCVSNDSDTGSASDTL